MIIIERFSVGIMGTSAHKLNNSGEDWIPSRVVIKREKCTGEGGELKVAFSS